jgi:superfamily I DNA/RNA helicase
MAKQNPNNVEKLWCQECEKLIGKSGFDNHLKQHKQGLIKKKKSILSQPSIKPNNMEEQFPNDGNSKIVIVKRNSKAQVKEKKKNSNFKPKVELSEAEKTRRALEVLDKRVKDEDNFLISRNEIKFITFNIEEIIFDRHTFKVSNGFTLSENNSKINDSFNQIKDVFARKYGDEIKFKCRGNIILADPIFDQMIFRFETILNEKQNVKCKICNDFFLKENISDHEEECERMEILTRKVKEEKAKIEEKEKEERKLIEDIQEEEVKVNKDKPIIIYPSLKKRDDLLTLCYSIKEQRNHEKNCKNQTVGRFQVKSNKGEFKVLWLYNDVSGSTITKYDLNGKPIINIFDPNHSKVLYGSPISKNSKVVNDLLNSAKAKNAVEKGTITLLNKCNYSNRISGFTKAFKVQRIISEKEMVWPDLFSLIVEIEEIKSHIRKEQLSDHDLIEKLKLKQQQSLSFEELFIDSKPFIRESFSLRSQDILDDAQNSVKRKNIFNGTTTIIDGGPGTGKTTTLIQRIRYLTSAQVLTDYFDELKLTREKFDTLINTQNRNWIFFSPNQLHANYLKNNLAQEGLENNENYVQVWHKRLLRLAKDYSLLEDGKVLNEIGFFKNQKNIDKISIEFRNGLFETIIESFISSDDRIDFKSADYKTLFNRIEKRKSQISVSKDLDSLINFHQKFNDYQQDLKIIKTDVEKLYQDIYDKLKQTINYKYKDDLIIYLDEVNTKYEIIDYDKVINKTLKNLIQKLFNEALDKRIKLNKVEKEMKRFLKDELPTNNIQRIAEGNYLIDKYKFIGKPIDSILLESITKYYKAFRWSELSQKFRNKISDKIETHYSADEICFLISEINESIIQFRGKISTNIAMSHQFYKIYDSYSKNVIAVDEVSDLSLFDIKCIYSFRNNLISSVTLCGDIMQRMTGDGITTWDDLIGIVDDLEVIELKTSFRQSPTLLDLAREIYKEIIGKEAGYKPYLNKYKGEPKPLLFVSIDAQSRIEWILKRLDDVFIAYGKKLPSTAIFVSGFEKVQPLAKELTKINTKGQFSFTAYSDHKVDLDIKKNNVNIFSVDQIKGLEFEIVFFYDINEVGITVSNEELILRYIYVGLSRAAYYFGMTIPKKFEGRLKFLNHLIEKKTEW